MKTRTCAAVIAAASALLLWPAAQAASTARAVTWRTVYEDTFTGSTLSPAWSRYSGRDWLPSHFGLDGAGHLVLTMKYDNGAWHTGGAMMKSQYGGKYQVIAIRFRVDSHGAQSHRNIPMRWVDDPNYEWWQGESDYCEGSSLSGCTTFLHYGSSNSQVSHDYSADMTRWHTWRFVHRPDRHVIAWLDGRKVWDYAGTRTTVPDAFRRVVLQQEVSSSHPPASRSSYERILIDWMRVRTATVGGAS